MSILHPQTAVRQRVHKLEGVLRDAQEALSLCLEHHPYPATAPEYEQVRALCEKYGYGSVMSCASSIWQGRTPGGAFTVGPCKATVESTLQQIDKVLKGVL